MLLFCIDAAMGKLDLNEPAQEEVQDGGSVTQRVLLMKDKKTISPVVCLNPVENIQECWTIMSFHSMKKVNLPSSKFIMKPACDNVYQEKEWATFLNFLWTHNRVAVVEPAVYDFYILPPDAPDVTQVQVAFKKRISAFQLQPAMLDNTAKPSNLGEMNDSGKPMIGANYKMSIPMKHQCDDGNLGSSRSVQSCDASSTSDDSLLRDCCYVEDVLDACAKRRNTLGTRSTPKQRKEVASSESRGQERRLSPTKGDHLQFHAMGSHSIDEKQFFPKDAGLLEGTVPFGMKASMKGCQIHHFIDINATNANALFIPNSSYTLYGTHLRCGRSGAPFQVNDSGVGRTELDLRTHSLTTNDVSFHPKSYVHTHPSYFKTLGQTHSGWIFGAIAEIVDNARDARAKRLEISIESMYSKRDGKAIPVLSFVDDGCGMSHYEMVRMVSFGHEQAELDDPNHIGRFGVGFKTGAMRLGRNALVISQASKSRSVVLLSQTFNEDKDNFEIPIVSYLWQDNIMEIDTNVHSEAEANIHLKSIKKFSPFNEYFIGEKSALFGKNGTGTQIYIWDLDKWGSDYSLEWIENDIMIRSRRVRTRPGQISKQVPLDFSLRAYLEVIFLEPRMKIRLQGSLIKSRPLAKSLSMTAVEKDFIDGKPLQLTLGRCQLEWERRNCGIFLYWHGRLIEAYKRVGAMIHNADLGRGVLGVIDVTDIMTKEDGETLVLCNKLGFEDCEAYAKLEEWLGEKADIYWDTNYDDLVLVKSTTKYKPDNEWVQCNKCLKWRRLDDEFNSTLLPDEWFCNMSPYNGLCSIPEEKAEPGVVTVGQKRTRAKKNLQAHDSNVISTGVSPGDAAEAVENPALKRLRRGPRIGRKRK